MGSYAAAPIGAGSVERGGGEGCGSWVPLEHAHLDLEAESQLLSGFEAQEECLGAPVNIGIEVVCGTVGGAVLPPAARASAGSTASTAPFVPLRGPVLGAGRVLFSPLHLFTDIKLEAPTLVACRRTLKMGGVAAGRSPLWQALPASEGLGATTDA